MVIPVAVLPIILTISRKKSHVNVQVTVFCSRKCKRKNNAYKRWKIFCDCSRAAKNPPRRENEGERTETSSFSMIRDEQMGARWRTGSETLLGV
jgi:hypothetical protein